MSESDEGKPKEFFQVRMLRDVARTKARTLRAELREAELKYRQRKEQLQAICPHLDITECPEHEEYLDGGPGFPPTTVEAKRRCEDCELVHVATVRSSPLFQRSVSRTMDYREFRKDRD